MFGSEVIRPAEARFLGNPLYSKDIYGIEIGILSITSDSLAIYGQCLHFFGILSNNGTKKPVIWARLHNCLQ